MSVLFCCSLLSSYILPLRERGGGGETGHSQLLSLREAMERTGQDKKKKDAGRLSNVHQPSQIGTAGGRRYLLAMQ